MRERVRRGDRKIRFFRWHEREREKEREYKAKNFKKPNVSPTHLLNHSHSIWMVEPT